jgi:hypothetical protein
MGSAIRTGWCRRRAVNAVPSGKRFDSVHFPPLWSSAFRRKHGVAITGDLEQLFNSGASAWPSRSPQPPSYWGAEMIAFDRVLCNALVLASFLVITGVVLLH